MTVIQPPELKFPFADRARLGVHPPGDQVQAQFEEVFRVLRDLIAAIGRPPAVQSIELEALNPAAVTALGEALARRIAADVMASQGAAVEARAAVSAARLEQTRAQGFAALAEQGARLVEEGAGSALHKAADAAVRIEEAAHATVRAQQDVLGRSNVATRSAAAAEDWAVTSMEWAEHMPDTIPPNILTMMGITGDHWSSRWWANQASIIVSQITDAAEDAVGAVDEFESLYLGAHSLTPTTDGDGDPLIPGAMYFDTDDNIMYVWTGTAWQPLTGDVGITSAESLGSGTDIYAGQVGPTLQFNSIRAAGLSSLALAANTIDINTRAPTYAEVTGKPTTFPPGAHTHPTSEVIGLDSALASKEPTITGGTTAQYWRGDKSWQTLNKAAVGLSNVDNTADASKPLSTPQKTYIDAQDAALTTAIGGANSNADSRVQKAGDTMTGDLTIAKATPLIALEKANSGQAAQIGGYRTTSQRWGLVLGDTTTEGGANAGSDFALDRYSDAGTRIDSPLSITRSSGVVNFATTPTVAGSPLIGGATISDTAPATPNTGQFWWESDTGALFLRYNDGDSQQWVQVNANGLADAPNDGSFWGRMSGVWAKGVAQIEVTNNPAGAWIIPNPGGVQISGSGGLYVTGSAGLSVNGPISCSSGLTLSSGISAGATIQTPGVIIASAGFQTNALVAFSNVANFSIGYSNEAGWTTGTGIFKFFYSGTEAYRWEGAGYRPMTDNNKFLGAGSGYRWSQVYAGTSTISTSDENEKTDIRPLTQAEINVAKKLKPLICAYRWKEAVARKGADGARIHVGVVAQRVEEAFVSEGLEARDYGMFCEDEIEEWVEPKIEGEKGTPDARVIEEGRMVKTGRMRLGVRYEEVLAFIIGGM